VLSLTKWETRQEGTAAMHQQSAAPHRVVKRDLGQIWRPGSGSSSRVSFRTIWRRWPISWDGRPQTPSPALGTGLGSPGG
jgi:hypothetical protein